MDQKVSSRGAIPFLEASRIAANGRTNGENVFKKDSALNTPNNAPPSDRVNELFAPHPGRPIADMDAEKYSKN